MLRFEPPASECLVFTYKEGVLSALAHDLQIRVTRFSIDVDEATRRIEARFDADSLRVVTAMRGGVKSPGTLSASNKREIEGNIVRDVLDARNYPEIRFVSSAVELGDGTYRITGILTLHGRERQITIPARQDRDRYIAEVDVHQPDFDIRPYTAMLGTLKVKADVTVRVSVPKPASSG